MPPRVASTPQARQNAIQAARNLRFERSGPPSANQRLSGVAWAALRSSIGVVEAMRENLRHQAFRRSAGTAEDLELGLAAKGAPGLSPHRRPFETEAADGLGNTVLASLWGLERLARPHHVPQLAGLHHPLEHQLTATPGRGSARFEDDVITRSRLTERRILDWSDVRRLIDGCRLLPFLRGFACLFSWTARVATAGRFTPAHRGTTP